MNEVRNLGDFEPTSFDYSQLDDETSVFLKQRVRNMESIADDTRYRMGKELFQAQERLADHYKGTFVKWFKSLGLDKDNVYFWINEFKFSRNLENTKQALNFGSASKSLKKDVMKKNAPNEAKQAVLNGDITTHKEYVALEKKLKQREQELSDKNAQIADQQAELEDNRKTQLELNNRLAEANKQLTQVFPITKEYKGHTWGSKDYYTVTDWIGENVGWNNKIPNGIEFLLEYLNINVQLTAVRIMNILGKFHQRQTGRDVLIDFLKSQGADIHYIDGND